MQQTLDREYTDLRLAPPDWYLRLALHAELSLFEMLSLWLYYCDASRYEIGVVLGKGERSVAEAIVRAQRKVAQNEPVAVDVHGELVSALRARLVREARDVLRCVRNEITRRGGGFSPGDGLPRVREVTAEDLAEERLARLVGSR